MSTSLAERPAPPPATVVPVLDRDRPVGAWIIERDRVVFRPVIDLTGLAGALLAFSAVAVTAVAASRRRTAIGAVTMGPGGWVSVKGTGTPRLRSDAHRPWWAHLLGAHPLVVDTKPRRPRHR
ncbi:hypothetical protein [Paractinoplanes hotanensis]|uniref:Uncharacterized protein n=1 Tax=Paractinoplanes hotanensis TaxID=2906497 RepID=A0ABT0YGH5_9ACTN|nr:hypothetical protein [Actinoplanes hotanensis]MCM4084855.1 hypothetical protein [Actinoplanes hotanensis]